MSEPVQLAKAAREKLAAALNALQTQDDVPSELLEVAEPIAQAMSVLHRIERTHGENLEGRDGALSSVRAALDLLQKIATSHEAVDVVMEKVAGSLSKVHALARYQPPVAQPAPQPAPVAQPAPQPVPVAQPQPAPQPIAAAPVVQVAPAPQPIAAAPAVQVAPVAQPAPQPVHAPVDVKMTLPMTPGPAPTPAYQPAVQPAPQPVVQPAPMPAHHAVAQPAPPPAAQPAPFPAYQGQPTYQSPPPAARKVPAERPSQPRSSVPAVDVELGIHSASNFYKGLGGNDVVEHGGLFVATYKALQIGTPVALHVHLPGDYEFHASGVVQWTRDAGTGEPGFGARLTQISPEGRQLVYRYTRNREPMFYDDL
jgi:Tfp pilus assembly protein PilZ